MDQEIIDFVIKRYDKLFKRLAQYDIGRCDMNSQTEFFECDCISDEHTLKFKLDAHDPTDVELYTSVFLNQYRGFFSRLWVAIKYVFGYKCKYGHWDCTILRLEDADRLIALLQKYKQLKVMKT